MGDLIESRALSGTGTDTKSLCEFCTAIDFAQIGYLRRTYPLKDWWKKRKVSEFLEGAKDCIFCEQVAHFCSNWKSEKHGDFNSLNIGEAVVYVDFLQIGSHDVTSSNDPLASLVYLSAALEIEKPENLGRGFCGGAALFQRFPTDVRTVAGFLAEGEDEDEECNPEEAYIGRFRSLTINLRLLRKWKSLCDRNHHGVCNVGLGSNLRFLRLIDVKRKCLVDTSSDVAYVALSYVWGERTEPYLVRDTEASSRKAGSLTAGTLPATITDAMIATDALAERYLWVDTCCIIQDDEGDKLRFLPHMDSIYGGATVTIIAAAGSNSDSGLPGIRAETRHQIQTPFIVKGIKLIQTLDSAETENCNSYLRESTWNERGWTFQERLVSNRCLVFTAEQIYWECKTALWCEDSSREHPSFPAIYRHCIDDTFARQPLNAEIGHLDQLYCQLVDNYSSRAFKNEEDYYHGFLGITRAFTRLNAPHLADEIPFLWHLPVSHFSSALAWPVDTAPSYRSKRRLGLHLLEANSPVRYRLPSWSWVGWYDQVQFGEVHEPLLPWNLSGIEFYTLTEGLTFQELPEPHFSSPDDMTMAWRGTEKVPSRQNLPLKFPRGAGSMNALCFWSSVAEVLVPASPRYPILMRVPNGHASAAITWKHVPNDIRRPHEAYLAVVVGITADLKSLNVLLVESDMGVYYRSGLLTVREEDWMIFDREWKQVTLC